MLKFLPALLISALLLAPVDPASAADPAIRPAPEAGTPPPADSPPPSDAITPESIKAAMSGAEADPKLDVAARGRIREQYQSALQQLDLAAQNRAREAEYRSAIANAPAETARLRNLLKQPSPDVTAILATNAPAGSPLEKLRERLAAEQARAQTLRSQLQQLNQQIAERQARPAGRSQQRQAAEQLLAQTGTNLQAAPPPGLSKQELAARRALLEARNQAARSEIAMLDQEGLAQAPLTDLLTVQRAATTRDAGLAEAVAGALETRVNELSAAEARRVGVEAEKARLESRNKNPLLQALARTNAFYAGRLQQVVQLNTNIADQLRQLQQQASRTRQAFTNIGRQFEETGLNEALAEVMFSEGRRLRQSGSSDLRRAQATTRAIIISNAIERIKVERELEPLQLPERYLDSLMNGMSPDDRPPAGEALDALRSDARSLLTARQKIIESSQSAHNELMENLRQLDLAQTDMIKLVSAFNDYIRARLMWTPSSPPISLDDFRKLGPGLAWLLSPPNWRDVLNGARREARRAPISTGILLLSAAGMLALRRRLTQLHRQIGSQVRSLRTDSIGHTVRSLVLSLFEFAPWLLLPYLAGRALAGDVENSDFAQAFGFALQRSVATTVYLALLLAVCRQDGVAEVHFRWDPAVVRLVRRYVAWMLGMLLPAYLVLGITFSELRAEYQDSLGRVVYIIALLLMGVIFHRLFHPRGGRLWLALNLHTNESELTRESLIIRLRRWWYPVLLGFPAWLIVLSLIGYVYTAVRLNVQVNASLLLVIAAVIGYFLIVRWLAVKKGKIAFQQRLDRRREAAGARNDAQKSGDTVPPPEEPEIDLAELTFQTRQLIRTFAGLVVVIGLWWIWSAELPALEYLNRITLWKVTTLVNGVEQTVPVTLAGVIAAAALGFLFAVGYQNLPGMLEIMVLQNFNLARGSRYAITTIAQYAVAACGIIVVLSRLGMNWSQLGWIAAALSVGLGFGLQEVVANFVCGILIFVEQPVRVGDIVTVADVTGTVTRIQIRATTITDWDRKEFIVPNKEFITGRILNWTLSNTMSRITIDVGIAYGSDTDLACRLLLEAGREHPQVLDDPAPMAHFEGFGESSLDLKLRCYLATADNRLDIMHGLRTVIARKFKAAGLEIPFPQRDLHIRSAGPLIRTGSTSGDSRLDAS